MPILDSLEAKLNWVTVGLSSITINAQNVTRNYNST
jgi:hypothetical protein